MKKGSTMPHLFTTTPRHLAATPTDQSNHPRHKQPSQSNPSSATPTHTAQHVATIPKEKIKNEPTCQNGSPTLSAHPLIDPHAQSAGDRITQFG